MGSQTGDGATPARIVVVGSINMDLVTRVRSLPRPGQTVRGRGYQEIPGGKGANQAVAVARLGGRSTMVGRVGGDGFGTRLLAALESSGVETDAIAVSADSSSGLALICIEDGGENAITAIAGANDQLSTRDIQLVEERIASADVLLVQLEVPLETVDAALGLARQHGVLTILDPAPALDTMPEALFDVDVLCPNETEAESILGAPVDGVDGAVAAARELVARGVRNAVITLGAAGSVLCKGDGCYRVPAPAITAVDTTAAGDAFAAALAVTLAEGQPAEQALRFANAAGAAAATRLGAQLAMPSRALVDALIEGFR